MTITLADWPPTSWRYYTAQFIDVHIHVHWVLSCSQLPDNFTLADLSGSADASLPVVLTPDLQRNRDMFQSWLHTTNKQPFIIVGPEGCGKE